MPTVIGWRAWYTEGRSFRSTDSSWADLPDDGMLGVVLCEDTLAPNGSHTRRNLVGYEWYFYAPPDIYGGNEDSKRINQRRYRGAQQKRGQWTSAADMARVQREMDDEWFAWLTSAQLTPPTPIEPCGGC